MWRFLGIFILVLTALFTLQLVESVHNGVVLPWTGLLAKMSAWLITPFDPDMVAYGKVLQSKRSGIGVSIEPGCNGIEACIILFAAIIAFPSTLKQKIGGIILGFVAIQALNLVRIISLFYLAGWNHDWFEFAHLYLWQVLIMLDVIVVWLLWVRIATRRGAQNHVATA